MILIVNVCKEKLHYYEFVKPVEDVLSGFEYFTKHYNDVQKSDLNKCEKIIICGTSLKDNRFLKDIERFNWLKEINKPVLGICAGMQIIGLVFRGKLKKKTEIGFYHEEFENFLGLNGKIQVYHLHNNHVEFGNEFKRYSDNEIVQAVKHKTKNIYGVLFHPEVRNKQLFIEFLNR